MENEDSEWTPPPPPDTGAFINNGFTLLEAAITVAIAVFITTSFLIVKNFLL